MKSKIRTITFLGLLFAVAIVLSYIESLIPAIIPIPGIKIGLSNIATMYCLFYMGKGYAACLAALKSVFVFMTRGAIASILSFSGGMISLLVMILVYRYFKGSYLFTSILGGVFHNVGQIAAASILLSTIELFYYLPVLIITGIIVGYLTGKFLQIILPAIQRVSGGKY